jgi:nucleoside-diphosphate-sugar epimerase
MSGQGTVLVTGGSGFIGSWCVIGLLQQGYTVRTTVRSLGRESAVRAAIGKVMDPQDRLSFHAAELTTDAGWDAAASGCDYVLHVASPVAVSEPKNPDELIVPARDGTRRAVGAALEAGVKRVVLTSSVAAASPRASARESVSDETVWTDLDDPTVSAYARSKTLAERAAWDLIDASGGATTLATVNPSVVLGPVLSRDFSESVQAVQRLLSGRVPGLPRLGFSFVDVRDVADLHIRAMTAPEAAG